MNEEYTVLKAESVTKTYHKSGKAIHAVDHISFSVKRGEILGIVGESGSGKSTLLRQIACLERMDSGKIYLEGKNITGSSTREVCDRMQMIFQNAAGSFNPRRRIRKSLDETLTFVAGLKGKERGTRRDELVRMVGLHPELAERYPSGLSGGQCQRMAIARALAANPGILLCDEITSALDVSAQAQIVQLLSKLCRQLSMTAIFVSHDLAVVSSLCDRILVMHHGSCVEQGTTEEIIRHTQNDYTKTLLESVLTV